MDWRCQHLTPIRTESGAILLVAQDTVHIQTLFKIVAPLHAARHHWLVRVFSRWRLDFLAVSAAATVVTVRRPRQGHHRGTVVLRHNAVKSKGCCAEYTKRGYWHERAQRPSISHRYRMASGQLATGADGGQFPFFRVVTVAAILESP